MSVRDLSLDLIIAARTKANSLKQSTRVLNVADKIGSPESQAAAKQAARSLPTKEEIIQRVLREIDLSSKEGAWGGFFQIPPNFKTALVKYFTDKKFIVITSDTLFKGYLFLSWLNSKWIKNYFGQTALNIFQVSAKIEKCKQIKSTLMDMMNDNPNKVKITENALKYWSPTEATFKSGRAFDFVKSIK